MSTPRGFRPTDLVALVSFDGTVFRNEAVTWDRLSKAHETPSVVESALEGMFSFATGRHTWISVEGQRIRALVSGRRRAGQAAWEVDTLLATDEHPSPAPDLLGQMAEAARSSGAQRVFLRLMEGSPVTEQALGAGFLPYRRDLTCTRAGAPAPLPAPEGFRLRLDSDAMSLFRLYCETTPEFIRSQEAATLGQWLALRERDGTRAHQEFVVEEEDGRISAWLRAARDGRAVRLMPLLLHPDRRAAAGAFTAAAVEAMTGRKGVEFVVALVSEHVAGYAPALMEAGFDEGQAYKTMVLKLAQEIRLPRRRLAFVPRAGTRVVSMGSTLARTEAAV